MARTNKKKSVLLRIALLGFSVYMIVMLGSLQAELVKEKREYNSYQQKINDLKYEIEEWTNLLKEGNESEFIERAARDRLGYVFPDEQVYKGISGM